MNNNSHELNEVSPHLNLRNLIIVLLVLIGIYFLLPKLVGLEQALKLLGQVNKFYLLLAIGAEIISYIGAAWLLGVILSKLGHSLPFFTRFRLASIAAFTIHFVPLGTAGQAAFDYYFLRRHSVEAGSILLMWVLRLIFTYVGFLLVFLIGLSLVPTYPHLPLSPKYISLIIFVLIIAAVYYIVYLYQHPQIFRTQWRKIFAFANSFLIKFKRKPIAPEKETEIFNDTYDGIGLFGSKKRTSAMAIVGSLIYWLGDITCFYFVFLAFGYHIGWGILIFGYCIATLIGLLTTIPGGIGVTEGSLALLLTSVGVPGTLAITATLVFRLFSFWMWIPIGFVSYLSLRNQNKRKFYPERSRGA